MTGVVVDASVVAAWVFEDERTPASARLLKMLKSAAIVVPAVWPFEIANMLVNAERRRRLGPGESAAAYSILQSLDLRVQDAPQLDRIPLIVALAANQGLSAYDAAYLELAAHAALPLATRDGQLVTAAARIGVELVFGQRNRE